MAKTSLLQRRGLMKYCTDYRRVLWVALLVMLFARPSLSESGDWNQWRGPNRDGNVGQGEWPDAIGGRLQLMWERPHAPSYSGPVVVGNRVVTTETVAKSMERVTAYDLESGEKSWQVEWPGAMSVPFFAAANGSWIRSTPASTESALVVLGIRDVLVCLDPQTGAERWRIDFPKDLGTPLPSFGGVCSPLIDGDSVYVQNGGALVKISLSDGQLVWRTLNDSAGMMSSGAFSSPTIETIAGKRQLVVQTRQELCGVDLDSGEVLWRQSIEAFRGMNILTPLVIGDQVFTSAHSGRAQLFEVRREKEAGKERWRVVERWKQRSQAYMSSPILIDDTIYMHMKNERVSAFSVDTGSILWTSTPQGKYWSMVTNGKKILALNNRGELLLLKASDSEFEVLDRMQVAQDSWAHLAVQGDQVLVRDLQALKVFRWR